MNKSEFFRLSNTAKLILMNLHPCEIRIRGLKNSPFNYEDFGSELANSDNYLLFPHKDSKKITETKLLQSSPAQKVLIIPDGNWSQAAKIAHQIKRKAPVNLVQLADPPTSLYKLRTNPNQERVSTFEASFHAIKNILDEKNKEKLTETFHNFVENVLKLRGKLKKTDHRD